MNSCDCMTMWVVPSRYGVLGFSTTWPLALRLRRSLASAGRVMYRHSRSSSFALVAGYALIAGRGTRLIEDGLALGMPIHPIKHETMQVDIKISGRAESLNERHRARVGSAAFKPRLLHQKSRADSVHDTQRRREQPGTSSEQNPKRDRKRKHPLPDRHARDDAIDQVRRRLDHARCANGNPTLARSPPCWRARPYSKSVDSYCSCTNGKSAIKHPQAPHS
jgi:hypothetical protein